MYILDKDKAQEILVTELGYKSHEAALFLRGFPPLHDELAGAVQHWLEDRTITDVEGEGATIREIMQSQGYHFLLAVKEMNRLLDDNISLDDRQRLADILRKPAVHR